MTVYVSDRDNMRSSTEQRKRESSKQMMQLGSKRIERRQRAMNAVHSPPLSQPDIVTCLLSATSASSPHLFQHRQMQDGLFFLLLVKSRSIFVVVVVSSIAGGAHE